LRYFVSDVSSYFFQRFAGGFGEFLPPRYLDVDRGYRSGDLEMDRIDLQRFDRVLLAERVVDPLDDLLL